MAYRAEIEIIAKGVTKVTQLQKNLNQLANQIDHLNGPGSLGDFNKQLAQATKLMGRAQQGTIEEKRAIEQYVTALKNANGAQERTNRLIAEEIRQRDGATAALKRYDVAAASRAKPGRSRPRQVPLAGQTAFSEPIGPQPSFLTGLSSTTGGRIRGIKKAQEAMLAAEREVEAVTKRIEEQFTARQLANDDRVFREKLNQIELLNKKELANIKQRDKAELAAFDRRLNQRVQGKDRRKRKFTDIATGAGFPLLFGGGPLQALAGGLGGAAGGLGGAIAGSAIASQVEGFARAAAETGVALTSTGGALELVREKSLFSKDANRELAAQLEEQGDAAGLAKLLTEELSLAIGNNGVNALQGLGDTTKETTRLWNLLTTQLFKLISGPLQGFLKIVNQVLGRITGAGSREAFFGDLGSQEAAARARFKELTGESLGTGKSGTEKRAEAVAKGRVFLSQEDALAQIRKEFQPEIVANIPVTDQDRRDITPGKTKAGRRSRVPDLNAEIQLQERLLTLNNQIAQAKRDENPVREAALQMEVALEKEAAKIAQIEAKRIPEIEKTLEKQLLQVQTSQELANIQNRLNDAKAQEAERAQDVLGSLLNEQALLQATLKGRKEEEQIKQRLAEIMKQNPTLAEAEVKALLEGNQALKEKITLQQQQEQLYARIGQTISSGIVNGIQSAIDGSKSLGESLSGILKQLGGMFLQSAIGGFGTGGKPGTGLLGLLGFADGGYVTGPTPAVVGEGGEPEYVIPQSKMRESMARYSRGARGSAVIPENGEGGTSGEGGGTAVAAPIDVRYTVERINSVDYVTADQFQRGMQQAAAQGATQGEQRALTTLRQNTSQRRRIGL